MWARIINVALGLWLMITPAVLDVSSAARINDRVIGPFIVSFAFISIWEVLRPLRWLNVPLGLWMLLAPWVLGNPMWATVNEMGVGLTVAALSFVRGRVSRQYGGGWRTVLFGHPGWADELAQHGQQE